MKGMAVNCFQLRFWSVFFDDFIEKKT